MFDIYIDGDACPVKQETFRVAKRYQLKVYVVSGVPIFIPQAEWIIPVVAGQGFDVVDDWIVGHAGEGDIVVTNDVLLAARCINASARVLSPRGKIWDENNIGEALATRELLSELRQRGALDTGPSKSGKQHRSQFLSSLDMLINSIKKNIKTP